MRVASALVCLLQGAAVAAQEGCPEDVRYCTSNNQTQVRDPANDCEFPCCPDFDEDCPQPQVTTTSQLVPQLVDSPPGDGVFCTDDVRQCPSSPGGYQARDPANNCQFPCCPEIESCCLGDVKDVEGGEIKASFDPDQSATCTSPTCRRFRGKASESCAGFDLLVTLGSNRTVEIVTCPVNETLTIQLNGDQSPFTPDERSYFSRTAHKIETSTSIDLNNKESLDAQFVHAARILAEWPDGLEVAYELNATAERLRQGTPEILPPDHPSVPPNPPDIATRRVRRQLQAASLTYTSLCSNIGHWIHSDPSGFDYSAYARVGMDPPCQPPDGMQTLHEEHPDFGWSCTYPPFTAQADTLWTYGNCFGRCGQGCASFEQFTLDCAAYDFCTRVNDFGANCHDEFLYAIDDWLWSGNCDEETGEEVEPNITYSCLAEPEGTPTEMPIARNPPAATPTPRPAPEPTEQGAPTVPAPPGNCGVGTRYETTCGPSEFCCNDSCGICAPRGGGGGFCAGAPCLTAHGAAEAQTALLRSRDSWGPDSYDMTLAWTRGCPGYACPDGGGFGGDGRYAATVRVSVRGGDAATVPPGGVPTGIASTVPELFDVVQEALDRNAEHVEVAYDDSFGFPSGISVDDWVMVAGDEITYNITEFDLYS